MKAYLQGMVWVRGIEEGRPAGQGLGEGIQAGRLAGHDLGEEYTFVQDYTYRTITAHEGRPAGQDLSEDIHQPERTQHVGRVLTLHVLQTQQDRHQQLENRNSDKDIMVHQGFMFICHIHQNSSAK